MEDAENNRQIQPIRVAVSSYEGVLINKHLGVTENLLIFEIDKDGSRLIERRKTPARGAGDERWQELSLLLRDCTILLTGGIGERPLEVLTAGGIKVYEAEGMIEDAFLAIVCGKELRMPHRKVAGCCRAGAGLGGEGCG